MRKFSKEQQELIVGIVTLVFISLLFVGVHLWRLRCDFLPKEFVLYANFKKSDGLLDNAVVRLAGLPVGKVVSQELTSAYMVRIKMEFDKMPLLSTDTVAVIETGRGGRLDATNVILPIVSVITNIGLEHTEYLGRTLEAIAGTKAGIVKPGCDAVCYDGAPEAVETVRTVCREKNVPFHLVDFSQITPLKHSLDGQTFRWRGETMQLPLLGEYDSRFISLR